MTKRGALTKVGGSSMDLKKFVQAALIFTPVGFLPGPALLAGDAPPPTVSAPLAESIPMAKTSHPIAFPAGIPDSVQNGSAMIRLVIEEKGAITQSRVLKASLPQFGEAALAGVKQWTFSPGIDDGKPATMCIDVPVAFDRKPKKTGNFAEPQLAPRTSCALKDGPLGDLPESVADRALPGEIVFECMVGGDGQASGLRVLAASHIDYVLPALASSSQWTFTPAEQGDLPVATKLRGSVFYGDGKVPKPEQTLRMNGFMGADGQPADPAPRLAALVDPVWPYEALLNRESGSATVEFTVATNGVVKAVKVREATRPEFGAALAAAVSALQFEGAIKNGQGTEVTLIQHCEFDLTKRRAAKPDDWVERLIPLAKEKKISGGRGLDEPLAPLYRVMPVKPDTLAEGTKAQSVIEFVIDRDGRCRLPRIVSSSDAACGWAAATAVSQWVFKVPKRNGEPTPVKVQIPFTF